MLRRRPATLRAITRPRVAAAEAAANPRGRAPKWRWTSEYGPAINYYFCYADGSAGGAMKAYRHLTGEVPLMPQWMLGFWQCKERDASEKELLGVAAKYREMKVPVDGIIQDWQYWPSGNNTWGSHQFDPELPRPGRHVQDATRRALPRLDFSLAEI